jgi:hypothetical protein
MVNYRRAGTRHVPLTFKDLQQEGAAMKTMKKLMLIGMLAGSTVFTAGCLGTPGYRGDERNQIIFRNWNYEGGQMVDDFDHLMLLQPASRLTAWNVQ